MQSDQALKLSRLMVRAETTEQRIMLLKILQVRLKLFVFKAEITSSYNY